MYTQLHAYLTIYILTYTHTHAEAQILSHAHSNTDLLENVHTCVQYNVPMHTHTHRYIHAHICKRTHRYTNAYTNTCLPSQIHDTPHTHTHTQCVYTYAYDTNACSTSVSSTMAAPLQCICTRNLYTAVGQWQTSKMPPISPLQEPVTQAFLQKNQHLLRPWS